MFHIFRRRIVLRGTKHAPKHRHRYKRPVNPRTEGIPLHNQRWIKYERSPSPRICTVPKKNQKSKEKANNPGNPSLKFSLFLIKLSNKNH